MNKNFLLLTLLSISVYHSSVHAISLGGLWQKTVKEEVSKEYQVSGNCEITLTNIDGSCTIKPWNKHKIVIEAVKQGTAEEIKATSITCNTEDPQHPVITTAKKSDNPAQIHYTLMVPEEASVSIMQTKGFVKIRGIAGKIEVFLKEGLIEIVDSTKKVEARTGAGAITVHQKKLDSEDSIVLQTQRGAISLFLPRETAATLHAKTGQGTIDSDHLVWFTPITTKLNSLSRKRIEKEVDGTLAGPTGGAPITLETAKGSIQIKEY